LSSNPNDNIFSFEDSQTFYINIKTFFTHLRYENDEYFNYDLREPKRKIVRPDKVLQQTNKVVSNTDDWSNIPYYPTNKEKRLHAAEYLINSGKQIPITLMKQLQKDQEDTIKNDVYNVTPSHNNINYQHRIISKSPQTSHIPHPPNKYSPQYANYIGARPPATASARIKLGGVY